jgi:hypothetical protein
MSKKLGNLETKYISAIYRVCAAIDAGASEEEVNKERAARDSVLAEIRKINPKYDTGMYA